MAAKAYSLQYVGRRGKLHSVSLCLGKLRKWAFHLGKNTYKKSGYMPSWEPRAFWRGRAI